MELFRLFGSILIDDANALKSLREAEDASKNAKKKLDSTFGTVGKVAKIAGAAIATGFTAILADGISGAIEAENATAQLEAVLKSTGGVAGMTKDQLLGMADGLEQTTKFSAEAVMGAQSMLLTFTGIGKDVFPQVTEMALDMATALGGDASSQAQALGKALNDPIAGISKLTKQGVVFTEEQKNQITAMAEAGDVAGAQSVMLQELQKEFGGSAAAAGDTFSGKLEILKNKFGAVSKKVVEDLMPVLADILDWVDANMPTIESVVTTAFNAVGDAIGWVKDNSGWLIPVLGGLLGVFAALQIIGVVNALMTAYSTITSTQTLLQLALNAATSAFPGIWIALAIGAVIAIIVALVLNFDKVKAAALGLWNKIKEVFNGIKDAIGSAIGAVWDKIKSVFDKVKDVMTGPFEAAKGIIKGVIDTIKGFLSFKWEFPKLKMPHFKIENGSLNPLDWITNGLPKLSVDWYAKGAIFTKPTVMATPYGLKGFGDAGPEIAIGTSTLDKYLSNANKGGNVYNVNFYPQSMSDDELDRAFTYMNKRFGMAV